MTTLDPASETEICPSCEGHSLRITQEEELFRFGTGDTTVELRAHVPVHTCTTCDFQFTDQAAEKIRHEAVCQHLGVLNPSEIRRIRERYGFSRAQFSRLTAIGEASLARWERGALIQNVAYDQYLRLLQEPENLERLKRFRQPEEVITAAGGLGL